MHGRLRHRWGRMRAAAAWTCAWRSVGDAGATRHARHTCSMHTLRFHRRCSSTSRLEASRPAASPSASTAVSGSRWRVARCWPAVRASQLLRHQHARSLLAPLSTPFHSAVPHCHPCRRGAQDRGELREWGQAAAVVLSCLSLSCLPLCACAARWPTAAAHLRPARCVRSAAAATCSTLGRLACKIQQHLTYNYPEMGC